MAHCWAPPPDRTRDAGPVTTYDFTHRLEEIATWYGDVLTALSPASPDRDAKQLLLTHHRQFARLAAADPAPAAGVAAVQWARALLVLAPYAPQPQAAGRCLPPHDSQPTAATDLR